MKRDIDLIRNILLDIEKTPAGQEINNNLQYDGKDHLEITDHVAQLEEQGLIEALIPRDGRNMPRGYVIWRMTARGHDFIDAARNASLWGKAKTELKKQGLALGISLMTEYLKTLTKSQLGMPPAQ